jgi:regulator of PEP synthase PpsR (kinase-PPPase family)|tara:strand:+ start:170 stop:361 length:192 start_codon:yes stop_codon:yes gene_type:complete
MGHIGLMEEINILSYFNLNFIQNEFENSKKLFRKYNLLVIDVIRKMVEETASSDIKIYKIIKI